MLTSIKCVNNCKLIFTRHQPRLFLKALLVFILILFDQINDFLLLWRSSWIYANLALFPDLNFLELLCFITIAISGG